MLLIYITCLSYYTKLKSEGKDISNHPVLKKLIHLKTMLERIKTIDIKLKSQIDRLVRQSEETDDTRTNQANEAYRLRSQILNEEEENEEKEEEVEQEKENNEESKRKVLKYKVQKNMMEYFETKSENKKKNKKLEKMKERIRNSEYFEDLKNKLGDNPLEVKSHFTEIVFIWIIKDKFNQQLDDFEDENFVRLKVPKKELKKLKKKDKKENDLLSHTRDLKNITSILDEDINEEIHEQMKVKNSRKLMNEQLKSYIGNKTLRNGKGSANMNERREKKFEKKIENQKVWKKREFIRNKKE